MQEKWKSVSFNKNMQVSNKGRVRGLKTGKIWKLRINRGGYPSTSMYHLETKKAKSHTIHRLVAELFLEPVEGKTHVNHKDCNKSNNCVSNLEWCTLQENVDHYMENKFQHLITKEQVLYIRLEINKIGARKLAKQLNITEGYVLNVANGTYFKDIHTELIREKRTSFAKPVIQYTLDGLLVAEYKSTKEAAKKTGYHIYKIQRVVKGERKSHKGFTWSYA